MNQTLGGSSVSSFGSESCLVVLDNGPLSFAKTRAPRFVHVRMAKVCVRSKPCTRSPTFGSPGPGPQKSRQPVRSWKFALDFLDDPLQAWASKQSKASNPRICTTFDTAEWPRPAGPLHVSMGLRRLAASSRGDLLIHSREKVIGLLCHK
jgi:hypothetical protein